MTGLNSYNARRITEQEREGFNQIREHRNKLIHFFHPKYVGEPDSATLQSVVAEQCKGWFYLQRLLTERWRGEFEDYLNVIESLHVLMRNQRGFLQAKFDDIRPSIEKGKERGMVFATCYYCGYESCKQEEVIAGSLIVDKCLVCEERLRKLKVSCPSCNSDILVLELGEGKCDNCGTQINIDYLVDKYAEYQRPKDYSIEPRRAYCGDCEYTLQPTVVPFGSKWLCLCCLTLSEEYEVRHCGWCGEKVTGDTGDYYSPGCVMCRVHIERDAGFIEERET